MIQNGCWDSLRDNSRNENNIHQHLAQELKSSIRESNLATHTIIVSFAVYPLISKRTVFLIERKWVYKTDENSLIIKQK